MKRFEVDAEARYPDFGCNNEIYAEGDFLEIESLGPLGLLAPEATVEHTERWFLSTRDRPRRLAVDRGERGRGRRSRAGHPARNGAGQRK